MLKDEEILPVCRTIAKRFVRQGLKVIGGERKDVLDELINAAYVHAKPLKDTHHLRTWIVWKLSEYVSSSRDVGASKHSGAVIDERVGLIRSGEMDPSIIAEMNEERERLIGAMKKIDGARREMLMMRYRDEMTFPEIGEVYGVSRSTVSREIKQVIEELKELMR